MNEIRLCVDQIVEAVRIDRYISGQVSELSRSRIQQLIKDGHVLLNNETVKRVGEKVKNGDHILIHLPPPEPSEVLPEAISLDVLYEDEHFVAVNKPVGMTVHPTERIKTGTLVNALLYHIKNLSGIGGVLRPGIVHRLDRVTSGVLLVAKHDEAHRKISEQFKARQTKKIYNAIVHGSTSRLTGTVDQPIGRHPSDRKRMAIRPDGRKSVTRYKILREGLGGLFVEVYPVTGRTHQIRVHLKHVGLPIVGDSIYNTRKYMGRGELERIFESYPGIALHARSLKFEHPMTGNIIQVETPLPDIFKIVQEQFHDIA